MRKQVPRPRRKEWQAWLQWVVELRRAAKKQHATPMAALNAPRSLHTGAGLLSVPGGVCINPRYSMTYERERVGSHGKLRASSCALFCV